MRTVEARDRLPRNRGVNKEQPRREEPFQTGQAEKQAQLHSPVKDAILGQELDRFRQPQPG